MLSAQTISELRDLSNGFTVLYVEDNDGLRDKAYRLLRKLLTNVLCASDGEEGYALFKEHKPQIVITDIRMPKLDGLSMIEKIKKLEPSTKCIITSAFDDKEYLFKAIDSGIFHYMNKPVKVDELADTLQRCINAINVEENSSLFNSYADDILNYQSDLLVLMSKDKPIFVNQMFLDFFDIENIEEFEEEYTEFGSLLLEHQGFLSKNSCDNWFDEATKELDTLFHVKIADKEKENKHFILKIHPVPKKNNMYIMSLNDISDLNLLSLFDSKAVDKDSKIKSLSTIMKLMRVVQKNSAELKMHNFYKGLSITTAGIVTDVNDDNVLIKASYIQEKAAQYQHSIIISSEIFPSAIQCDTIKNIDFDEQTITVSDMYFSGMNPTQRKNVRVFPEDKHTVSLFVADRKFYNDVKIHDISIEAVKLDLISLPAGVSVGTEVTVNIVLEHYKQPVIIHPSATVFRIDEMASNYFVVLVFELTQKDKKLLVEYIAKRQMNLISEFKGMRFGS